MTMLILTIVNLDEQTRVQLFGVNLSMRFGFTSGKLKKLCRSTPNKDSIKTPYV